MMTVNCRSAALKRLWELKSKWTMEPERESMMKTENFARRICSGSY
ncbi:MAG: hypothetical protein JXR78_17825 [Victivallales bacterium]|nr:hypothetical protein [Victivallales bacterium]